MLEDVENIVLVRIPFNFIRAAKKQQQEETQATFYEPMVWEDEVARKLVSEDGYTLVAYLPGLVQPAGIVSLQPYCTFPINMIPQKRLNRCIYDYASVVKPHMGLSSTSADKVGCYIERPGELKGEIRLVRGWYAIGQEVSGIT